MDRNREARRGPMAASIGLSRRRHRNSGLRDSPDDDAAVELSEMVRLRDRGSSKKDRDRDRDRERDRLSRTKRRRGDRLIHGSNREDEDDSSEESVNDDEDEDDEDGGGGVGVRMLPPNHPSSLSSSSISNHHRKSYPPPAKVFRAAPTWKAADEMIGVSVPRKARSASTKRSHECWVSGGGVGGDQIQRQTSTSPLRTAPAPVSPTSSNASVRKKMRPNGAKQRPPKSSSKSSSSAQDEIEIEIAEVLYGMMRQPLVPSKQENMPNDSTNGDAKSRVSSPISNSPSTLAPQSISNTHMSAIAPKRKRPRPVKFEDENPPRNSPISKAEMDQPPKVDAPATNSEQVAGSATENGGPESVKLESHPSSGSKVLSDESESLVRKEEFPVQRLDNKREASMSTTTATAKANGEIETQREDKFQIDLMAPPPSRSSPEEGESEIEFVAVDPKPMVSDVDMEQKPGGGGMKEEEPKDGEAPVERKATKVEQEIESQKPPPPQADATNNKDIRMIDLQLDLEKPERNCSFPPPADKPPVILKHLQPSSTSHRTQNQATSVPVATWANGLPPLGYMAPLQGVVSMDGGNVPSATAAAAVQPPHLVFTQPRPKRCATHCYIARNICYHQQFTRINPFWPAAAGAASLYGPKPCNLNVLPPSADLHSNIPGRSVNSPQDKGEPANKDNPSQASLNMVDAAQRKQMYALPPGAPSNILHGPAFIFPLSQQQAAAASARSGSVMSPPAVGNNSASSGSAAAAASARAATAMSFNYPNMPGNETQYLAILQNGAYPFPIPTHVGPPAYRGTHGQAMPFFSGSFYSSQMLHPSQIQQQQLSTQSQPSQQGHQPQQSQHGHPNTSISSGSSSSQKQLQSPHHRSHGNGMNSGSGNLHGFPAPKNQPPQQLQPQQRQQQQQNSRQIDSEKVGGEDRSKAGVESLPTPAFAMSFASINGANANGIDISSFTQNHAILQSLPEATRHGYQIMAAAAAAQAAQQKKSYRFSEEGKGGSTDASNAEEDRKDAGGKPAALVGQSIAFSRPEQTDTNTSSAMPNNTVIDSSVRTLNLSSTPTWAPGYVMPATTNSVNGSSSQQQLQWQQQQQQMMHQLQKQHHFAAAAVARTKTPTSNGHAYSDHLPSSPAMASKFPTLSAFPQNLVQSTTSPAQSPQWKNSGRTTTPQAPPSMVSSTSSLKNLSQQQGRPQQNHTHISFAAKSKSSNTSQVHQIPSNNQSSSPPVMVGSPTSSMSKGAGGSPQPTTSSTGNKVVPSTLSSQQAKNSPSVPSRKSSPVGGRNAPSILGNPHTSSSAGTKHQFSQQQQAQLLFSNYAQAQAAHSASTDSTASATGGYYLQRRRAEQQQQQLQQGTSSSGMLSLCPPVSHAKSTTTDPAKAVAAAAASVKGGGLPSQGFLHAAQFAGAQSSGSSHQLVPGGFTYGVHTVSSAVQVKPAEQKQPVGEPRKSRQGTTLH